MTALLEKIVAIIAPHHCIICSKENNIACPECIAAYFPGLDTVCVLCAGPSEASKICAACRKVSSLDFVWAAAEYSSVPELLIRDFKFNRVKAAFVPLAAAIDAIMSYVPADTIVVPVPTAFARVRQRGYDQAALLAKEVARLRALQYDPFLIRQHNLRQLGTPRAARLEQAYDLFKIRGVVANKRILLVDDVCTTGATLRAAADTLAKAGAKEINAAVVAWTVPKQKQPN